MMQKNGGGRKDRGRALETGAESAANGREVFYLAAPAGRLLLRLFRYAAAAFVLSAASFQLLWFVTIPLFGWLFWLLSLFMVTWRRYLYAAVWAYGLIACAMALGFGFGPALRSVIGALLERL